MTATDQPKTVFHLRSTASLTPLGFALLALVRLVSGFTGLLPAPAYMMWLFTAVILLGIVRTLDVFITHLALDSAGLSYRSLYSKKALGWEQIESASVKLDLYRREVIRLDGAGVRISIDTRYKDYAKLRAMVLERCPKPALAG